MTDETRPATSTEVPASAAPITLGLVLILGGLVLLYLPALLDMLGGGEGAALLLWFLGGAGLIAGVVQLVIGIHRLADNVDRAARAVLETRRD